MIFLLFGEMGVGKNYVGKRLAHKLDCPFFDGDLAMPKEMKERVRKFKSLTNSMLTDFVENNLIPAIISNANPIKHKHLVVGQALYKREHRKEIRRRFGRTMFIHVVAPSFRVHMARIMTRPHGFRWAAYCVASKLFFERPGNSTYIINDIDYNIDRQINKFIINRAGVIK